MRGHGLVNVPDLNGAWTAFVTPSGDGHAREHPATMEVGQTWRSICVWLRRENWRSRIVTGAVIVEEAQDALLVYGCVNEPDGHALEGMHTHRGTARAFGGGRVLEGPLRRVLHRQNCGR
jgi:hypothetical protein